MCKEHIGSTIYIMVKFNPGLTLPPPPKMRETGREGRWRKEEIERGEDGGVFLVEDPFFLMTQKQGEERLEDLEDNRVVKATLSVNL